MQEEEIKKIQAQFNEVISYSQTGLENPHTDILFENWRKNKEKFINLFNGELIYEYPEPVSFELDDKTKDIKMNLFLDSLYDFGYVDLASFLDINKDGFYINRVIDSSNEHMYMIPKGMKLAKSFKFFIKDPIELEHWQQKYSMIIQENKIEGTLCLSVHPLDYLSSSENTYNWRSCHSLDGEYRTGNLSYMQDNCTIICYLKTSDTKVILPRFGGVKWNSKKWRMLLFMSDNNDMLFAGRQYPHEITGILDFLSNTVLPKLPFMRSVMWSGWNDEVVNSVSHENMHHNLDTYIPMDNELRKLNEVVIDPAIPLHFNDLLHSSVYKPKYSYALSRNIFGYERIRTRNNSKFYVGHDVTCLRCNKANVELSETMMCPQCELRYGDCENESYSYCPCCGERYFSDDGIWLSDTDEEYCEECFNEISFCCPGCNEYHHIDYSYYDEKTDETYCQSCYDEIMRERGKR